MQCYRQLHHSVFKTFNRFSLKSLYKLADVGITNFPSQTAEYISSPDKSVNSTLIFFKKGALTFRGSRGTQDLQSILWLFRNKLMKKLRCRSIFNQLKIIKSNFFDFIKNEKFNKHFFVVSYELQEIYLFYTLHNLLIYRDYFSKHVIYNIALQNFVSCRFLRKINYG